MLWWLKIRFGFLHCDFRLELQLGRPKGVLHSNKPRKFTSLVEIEVVVLVRELGGDALAVQVGSDSRARPFLDSGEHRTVLMVARGEICSCRHCRGSVKVLPVV